MTTAAVATIPPAARGRGRSHARAFTLVELLVVIAVISLLLAIVVPAAGPIARMANSVTCSSNVHQMGTAAHEYAVDNHGQLPRDVWENQFGHYFFGARFLPYLGGEFIPAGDADRDFPAIAEKIKHVGVYRCPAVDKPGWYLHYVINGVDFGRFEKGEGYQSSPTCRVNQMVVSPGAAMYLMEFNPDYSGMGPTSFGYYDVWTPGHVPFNGYTPNANPRMIHADDDRHFGRTTVAFFDGHAETRELTPFGVPLSLLNPLDKSQDPQ